jgi:hypothetical protein
LPSIRVCYFLNPPYSGWSRKNSQNALKAAHPEAAIAHKGEELSMNADSLNESPELLTRIVLRPLGSPLPLGFFAFATGTVLLSLLELRWMPLSESKTLAIFLLAFVAPLELLAGIFGFLSRDAASGTAMSIFGCSWVAMSITFLVSGALARSTVTGVFLIMDSLALLALAIPAVKPKPLLAIILFLATVRFLLAAAVQLGAGTRASMAAGITGLLIGVMAVYGGAALLLEEVQQKTVLPTFRTGAAKASMEGSLGEQLQRVRKDAGVRQQL